MSDRFHKLCMIARVNEPLAVLPNSDKSKAQFHAVRSGFGKPDHI